jgi:hypothetical protein
MLKKAVHELLEHLQVWVALRNSTKHADKAKVAKAVQRVKDLAHRIATLAELGSDEKK